MKVGFLTIGQSPRTDVMRDLAPLLPPGLEVVEKGALDGLTRREIEEELRPEPGMTVYVSRLRDGSQVSFAKEKILGRMQERIRELEEMGVDLIVILCSGEFPDFESRVPIIYPDKLLKAAVSGIRIRGPLGVFIPLQEQRRYAEEKWSRLGYKPVVEPVSPYRAPLKEFVEAAERMASRNVGLIVMDCIGYTFAQKNAVREITGIPVVSTRGLVARLIAELAS